MELNELRVSTADAAKALGLSEQTVAEYARQGKFKGNKTKAGHRLFKNGLRGWANGRGVPIPHPELLRDKHAPDWDVTPKAEEPNGSGKAPKSKGQKKTTSVKKEKEPQFVHEGPIVVSTPDPGMAGMGEPLVEEAPEPVVRSIGESVPAPKPESRRKSRGKKKEPDPMETAEQLLRDGGPEL